MSRNKILTILLIVLIAMVFRRYDAFINPQLWAEDGMVFLQEYEQYGFRSLFMPYAGYFHTVPRIVALLVGVLHIDLLFVPAVYNASAFVIAFGVALYLYKCAVRIDLKYPIVFATSFLFLPIDSEIYMNITNSIWFCQMLLVVYVFIGQPYEQHKPSRTSPFYTKLFVALIISLTGPGSLIISPIIALVIFLERKAMPIKKLAPLLIIMVGGLIQLLSIKFSGTNTIRTYVPESVEPFHLIKFFTLNIKQTLFLSPLFESSTSELYEMTVTALIGILLLFLFFVLYKKVQTKRKYVPLLAAILYLTSFIVAYWPNAWTILALNSPRYYFVPYTCIMLLMIIGFDHYLKPVHIAAYLLFFSFHREKIVFSLPNKNWELQVQSYKAFGNSQIKINPDGWNVTLPHKKTYVTTIDYTAFPPDTWFGEEKVVAIWGNTLLTAKEIQLPKGKYTLSVFMKGTPVNDVYPHLNLYVNNKKIGSMYIDKEYKAYTLPFEVEDSLPVSVAIDMDNDTAGYGEDRNSYIHAFFVHTQ